MITLPPTLPPSGRDLDWLMDGLMAVGFRPLFEVACGSNGSPTHGLLLERVRHHGESNAPWSLDAALAVLCTSSCCATRAVASSSRGGRIYTCNAFETHAGMGQRKKWKETIHVLSSGRSLKRWFSSRDAAALQLGHPTPPSQDASTYGGVAPFDASQADYGIQAGSAGYDGARDPAAAYGVQVSGPAAAYGSRDFADPSSRSSATHRLFERAGRATYPAAVPSLPLAPALGLGTLAHPLSGSLRAPILPHALEQAHAPDGSGALAAILALLANAAEQRACPPPGLATGAAPTCAGQLLDPAVAAVQGRLAASPDALAAARALPPSERTESGRTASGSHGAPGAHARTSADDATSAQHGEAEETGDVPISTPERRAPAPVLASKLTGPRLPRTPRDFAQLQRGTSGSDSSRPASPDTAHPAAEARTWTLFRNSAEASVHASPDRDSAAFAGAKRAREVDASADDASRGKLYALDSGVGSPAASPAALDALRVTDPAGAPAAFGPYASSLAGLLAATAGGQSSDALAGLLAAAPAPDAPPLEAADLWRAVLTLVGAAQTVHSDIADLLRAVNSLSSASGDGQTASGPLAPEAGHADSLGIKATAEWS